MSYTHQNGRAPHHPPGDSRKSPLRVVFDHRLKLELHGSKITSEAGLRAYRELDDTLGLTGSAGEVFYDSRTGKNGWHGITGQFRQSVFGRLGGYEDVNDADRLGRDPAMRWIVGGKALDRQAASTSQMARFETELLATDANIEVLADMSGRDRLPQAVRNTPKRPVVTPQREWLQFNLASKIEAMIEDPIFTQTGLFNVDKVRKKYREFRRQGAENSFFVWQWINAYMWFKNFAPRT